MLNTLFSSGKRPSKTHWVPDSKATHCAARGCGKLFDTKIRRHHCRRCGLVFCDEHLAHRMRLNAQAEPDEEGEMSKVCESCFMKQLEPATPAPVHVNHVLVVHRAGEVTSRSRFDLFRAHRAEYNKEMSRRSSSVIEVYEKVRQLSSRRDRKQVVNWEPDAKTPRCSGCKRAFTAVLRKHHCRLCGTVVCSDCSSKHKPAKVAGGARPQDVMIAEDNTVRACRQCDEYICRWERSQAEARVRAEAKQSPFMLQYISLATTHTTVRELLRHFEQQVTMLGTRGATATVEDAKQVETALSQMLPALGNAIKRFVTSEVQPNEVALREGAKVWVRFAPTALLQESTPRFHALKRQLEAKAAQKALLAAPPDADVSASSCASSSTAASTAAASTADTSAAVAPSTARTSCALIDPKAEGSECGLTAGLPPAGEAEAWAQAPLFPPAATATTRGELPADSTASSGGAASAPSLVWPPSDERLPVWPPRPPSSTNPFASPAPSPVARVAPQAFPARPPAAGPPPSLVPKPSSPSPSQSPPPMKASAPSHDVVGPINAPLAKLGAGDPRIELAEFLMAKKSLVDLSRSSLSYSDAMLQSVERLEEIKETLQRAMYYLTEELQYWATPLRLDWNGQLREITAAIAAPRPNDSGPRFASTKEDLLSKLLGVAVGACSRIDDDVSDKVFVRSRGALHQLKSLLKEVYMHECIPY